MLAIRLLLPLFGLLLAVLLWALGVWALSAATPIAHDFSPTEAAKALLHLLADGQFWHHLFIGLKRVAIGLLGALLIGVPLGVLSGMSVHFALATTPLFQLLRMISPLSWMPLAVMTL